MKLNWIYITCKDLEEATYLSRLIVNKRLAACTNVFAPMHSFYRWKGELIEDTETVLIAKTTADMVDLLIERVKEWHSYEVPCIISLPIEKGNPEYLNWLVENVKPVSNTKLYNDGKSNH